MYSLPCIPLREPRRRSVLSLVLGLSWTQNTWKGCLRHLVLIITSPVTWKPRSTSQPATEAAGDVCTCIVIAYDGMGLSCKLVDVGVAKPPDSNWQRIVHIYIYILYICIYVSTCTKGHGRRKGRTRQRYNKPQSFAGMASNSLQSANFQVIKCVATWLRHVIVFYKESESRERERERERKREGFGDARASLWRLLA